MDIVAAIAEDQGFEYEMKSLGWDAAIAACQSGQADGMIAGASITDERKASGWTFSDGYYDSTQTMTVAADSDITGFADLSGKTVAVKTATQGASYAESLKDEYGFNITYFEDSPTMYQAVLGGQCVACFEDTPIMKASIKDGDLALKVLNDTASDPAPYGFCHLQHRQPGAAGYVQRWSCGHQGERQVRRDSGKVPRLITKPHAGTSFWGRPRFCDPAHPRV